MDSDTNRFVRDRENIWLIARNLLNNAGCDWEADDALNLSIFLAGDALPVARDTSPDDDEDDTPGGDEDEEEAAE